MTLEQLNEAIKRGDIDPDAVTVEEMSRAVLASSIAWLAEGRSNNCTRCVGSGWVWGRKPEIGRIPATGTRYLTGNTISARVTCPECVGTGKRGAA